MGNAVDYVEVLEGAPAKTYKKTHLGKVYIKWLDLYTDEEEDGHLQGVGDEETCYIELWTPRQIAHFESRNRNAIRNGWIAEKPMPKDAKIYTPNKLNTEEMDQIMSNFQLLKSRLPDITSKSTLQKLLERAEKANRPAATLEIIKTRLSEAQAGN
jgi:hypothetical protein